ncbi:MAG: response regulator [Lysobacteraceae bacterium]
MTAALSVDTRERIARECRQLVLSQGRAGAIATLLIAVLFIATLRDVHPRALLAGWAVAVGAASLLRIWLASPSMWQADADGDSRAGKPLVCLLLGAFCGGVWGAASTLLFPLGHSELYFVVAFLLISMPAAAVSSFGAWWPAHAAYVLCNVGPFALYFLLSGRTDFMVAGVAACLFTLFLLRQGIVISRTIRHNIAQRTALMDMTKTLGEALDRADAANRAKSTFLANMSHELRTPLNAIIGMSQLLAEAPDAPAHRDLPRSIRRAGQSLLALISDVLDMSQIEAGKISLCIAAFPPLRLIEDVADMFGPQAQSKGLRLETEIAPDLPAHFAGDQARLRQVLVNLVGNAVKFTVHGSVRIEADAARDTAGRCVLRIAVVDTGPGIRKAEHVRIFQAFQQGDDSLTRAHPGTGLGLPISSDLVGLMGGRIELSSVPGAGSRFTVLLPEAPESAIDRRHAAPSQNDVETADFDLAGVRVLVAEDNALNASLVKLMLEREGCAVVCVGSGSEALAWMRTDGWDVVLMDCQMPGLDGYSATRQWRIFEQAERRPRLPIVALTAHAMADDRRRCIEAGMDDYLTKPLKREALCLALVRHAVRTAPAPLPQPESSPS